MKDISDYTLLHNKTALPFNMEIGMSDSLHDRGKVIEDLFFAENDKRLLDQMRAEMESKEQNAALSTASGITDEAVLKVLASSGITAETLTSLSLIPLVAVAWADKKMDPPEKEAILKAAGVVGIESGSAGYATMESWLNKQPGPELLAAWKAYIGSVKTTLDATAFGQLKTSIMGRAESVAESAGGFLGLKTVSDVERKVLDDLAATFG